MEKHVLSALAGLSGAAEACLDGHLYIVASTVLNDKGFKDGVGSAGKHHAYKGGLVVHTFEVVSNSLLLARASADPVSLEVLVTAGIFHDFMKIKEYEYNPETGEISKTQYRELIRHVCGSYSEFMRIAGSYQISEDIKINIGHAIISHHGRKEWGSPIEPKTNEARILHQADMMSAKPNFKEEESAQ